MITMLRVNYAPQFQQPQSKGPRKKPNPVLSGLAILSCVLLAVGSAGTWIDIAGIKVGGLDGGKDGQVTIVIAVLCAIFLILNAFISHKVFPILATLFAAFAVLAAVIDVADVLDNDFTVGWGLWLCLVASIALLILSLVLSVVSGKRQPPGYGGQGGYGQPQQQFGGQPGYGQPQQQFGGHPQQQQGGYPPQQQGGYPPQQQGWQ